MAGTMTVTVMASVLFAAKLWLFAYVKIFFFSRSSYESFYYCTVEWMKKRQGEADLHKLIEESGLILGSDLHFCNCFAATVLLYRWTSVCLLTYIFSPFSDVFQCSCSAFLHIFTVFKIQSKVTSGLACTKWWFLVSFL